MNNFELKRDNKLNTLKIKAYKSLIEDISHELEKILDETEPSNRIQKLKDKVDGFL